MARETPRPKGEAPRLDVVKRRKSPSGGESLHVKRQRRMGSLGKLVAAAGDAGLHDCAEALGLRVPDDRLPGRPPKHGAWAMLLFSSARAVYGSAKRVAEELRDEGVWPAVVKAATARIGADAARYELENGPPTLSQFNYFQQRMSALGLHDALHTEFEAAAARTAQDMGLMPDHARTGVKDAARANVLAVDGKNHTSPTRYVKGDQWVDKDTGEIKERRYDPNKSTWGEGGKNRVRQGAKSVVAWSRHPASGTRVIAGLTLMRPKHDGGEAAAIVDLITRVQDLNPGLTHVAVDGALRGTHLARLTPRGLVVVNKIQTAPTTAENAVTINGKRFRKKRVHTLTHHSTAFGACEHPIYGIGGGLFEEHVTSDGTVTHTRLPHHTTARGRKNGDYTDWYVQTRIACGRTDPTSGKLTPWTKTFYVPINPTRQDQIDNVNRGEHVRQIPEIDTDDFNRIYGMRADSESGNNGLEHAWYLDRIPSYGYDNQLLTLISYALMNNAVARATHHARAAARPPGQAA